MPSCLIDGFERQLAFEKEVASIFGVETMGAKNMAALKLAQHFAAESDHQKRLN